MRWTRQRFARDGIAGWVGERPVSDQTASGRTMLQRTAKSCGPDAPTRASSSRRQVGPTGRGQSLNPLSDGGKRARSPGRARRKPLKPLRAGMPGDSGVLVVTRVRSTTTSAHEAAGALGIRRSPRPLWAEDSSNASGAWRREVVKSYLELECRHCEERSDEAIQTPSFRGDAKHRTRNLEIPRCASAHLRSGPADHPGMTVFGIAPRSLSSGVHWYDP